MPTDEPGADPHPDPSRQSEDTTSPGDHDPREGAAAPSSGPAAAKNGEARGAAGAAGPSSPAHPPAATETKSDEPVWPPPESSPPDGAAAEPDEEMTLTESTLHWLVDGEEAVEPSEANPAIASTYDPRAPVAGRKRAVAVIGGASVIALGLALALHTQAERHMTPAAAPTVDSEAVLTERAEAALRGGRATEALELARLAVGSDPRTADAYIVIGTVEHSSGNLAEARAAFRRYLELAPIGTHAAEARAALAALPP